MNIYASDREQIELIKKWWEENGKFTLFCIMTVLILSAGWRYWQNSKNQEGAKVSQIYEQILNNEANHAYGSVELEVTSLMTQHPRTPYATLAAFVSAQNAVNAKHWDAAVEKFNWVIAHSKVADLIQIAKIRKARVLLAMKKYEEALSELSPISVDTYLPLIYELKGDILFAKGDKKAARTAYQTALNGLRQDAPNRHFLEMKYSQVTST